MVSAVTDRIYYRNTTTGEKGWLVSRDGKQFMQLNRPAEEILLPYRPTEWVPERDSRPLTRQQIAQVAFEADKKLCLFLGLHKESRRQWLSMTDEDRIEWCENGPLPDCESGLMRTIVFGVVLESLKPWATE